MKEKKSLKQAVILAGGLGTRLKPFTDDQPKAMFPIQGKPFIEYLIEQVKDFGITHILMLLGYKAEAFREYLGDGSRWNLTISYDITPVEYNTADRLLHAEDKIQDYFLLMYCDNYCPIDYKRLIQEFWEHDALIQLTAYENADHYTRDNLMIADDGKVRVYDKSRKSDNLAGVDIGYAVIDKQVLKLIDGEGKNFEACVYPQVLQKEKLYATETKHRYYSIGSYERIDLTKRFFTKRETVFLDRDGTVNERAPRACYIESPEQFVWLAGAREAIRLLNDHGYRVIMITNQPGIARGNLTEDTLHAIHDKMENDLEDMDARIDKIYFCPHDWDEGCDCRKPKPGMLYQAQKEFDLNLRECILIGDDDRDIEAGEAAGCKTYQVTKDTDLLQIVKELVKGK